MSTARQKPEVKLLPFQQENVSTNQQMIALPYLAGERVVAGRWITRSLDKQHRQADAKTKKG